MTTYDLALLFWQLALGFSLAATTGLRAFLPLFATAVAAKLGYLNLGTSFGWMASTPAVIVFGSAVVIEILGDKIPAVDHALDAAGVVVKPAAATLLAASFITGMDPLLSSVLGLATGGAVAGTVHVVKAQVRLASTTLTAGIANPVVSIAEDVATVAGIVLSILVPIFAAIFILTILTLIGVLLLRRVNRKAAPAPAALQTAG